MSNFTLSKTNDNRLQSYNTACYCGKFISILEIKHLSIFIETAGTEVTI